MFRSGLFPVCLGFLTLAVVACDPKPAAPEAPRKLLEERVDTACAAYQQYSARFQEREGLSIELFESSNCWIAAELALAQKPGDRVQALRDYVDRSRTLEQSVRAVRACEFREIDAAGYYVVNAEIRLQEAGGESKGREHKPTKELLAERVRAARSSFEGYMVQYRSQEGLGVEFFGWSERWLDAELSALEKPAQRAQALRNHLDRTRLVERIAAEYARQGDREVEVTAATWYRLGAEIRLLDAGIAPDATAAAAPETPEKLLAQRRESARKAFEGYYAENAAKEGFPLELFGWSERWLDGDLSLLETRDERIRALCHHL
ncbi:MAG TPA: hypothetical protein VHB77_08615, partial [Planctomycetaceae bacterium]|nr:hypothetical protein [Planctomycetaceae bacterium]